jgi:plasmid stabilization system protein ParE
VKPNLPSCIHDLHKTAQHIAEHQQRYAERKSLTGESGLGLYPVREHYIVYEPLTPKKMAIVDFIQQGRDIPALLSRYAPMFRRDLGKITKK